ncbi:hypothetical protein J5X84_14870 [Streptosporangiaceae bacterium NEAU-GS5]|nr:hypothetical protein [Streptosporangiaceae bacterium NEAU-GS5]
MTGRFSIRTRFPVPGGQRALRYEGPFGPITAECDGRAVRTAVQGDFVGQAEIDWGMWSFRHYYAERRLRLRRGVEGSVGGVGVLVSQPRRGWSRPARALWAEWPGRPERPAARFVLRGCRALVLERADGAPLVGSRPAWRGGLVTDAADAFDVALYVLVRAADLHFELEL